MSLLKPVIISILLTGWVVSSYAMRCGQSLVYEGDTTYLVKKKCGEPLDKQVFDSALVNGVGVPYGMVFGTSEVWTYQSSPNDFLYEVYFQDGVVVSITANRDF